MKNKPFFLIKQKHVRILTNHRTKLENVSHVLKCVLNNPTFTVVSLNIIPIIVSFKF